MIPIDFPHSSPLAPAIGLALAAQTAGKDSDNASRVIATDVCHESLDNLRSNALKNGLRVGTAQEILHEALQHSGTTPSLGISRWDASLGTLNTLPLPASDITHLIGADVVYHGGATDVEHPSNRMVRCPSSSLGRLFDRHAYMI